MTKRLRRSLLFLLLAAAMVCGYLYFKNIFLKEILGRFSSTIAKTTDLTVDIGGISYIPFQTFSFKDIAVFKSGLKKTKTADIKTLDITFDAPSFVKNRQLMDSIVTIEGKLVSKRDSYIFSFVRSRGRYQWYDISLRSDSVNLKIILVKDGDDLVIKKLSGAFPSLRFQAEGKIRDFLSPDVKDGYMFSADFATRELVLANMRADSMSGKVLFKEGILYMPGATGSTCEGAFEADIFMDLEDPSLPYEIYFAAGDVNFGKLVGDIDQKGSNIYGILNLKFFLKGCATDPRTIVGSGTMSIRDANIGPMPLLVPLVGELYSALQSMLTQKQAISINSAYADFHIQDRKILTDEAFLWGDKIYATGEGYLDFDGNLDLLFENQFRHPESADTEKWQNVLRTAIKTSGRSISKARLTGTVQKPKWEFEY